ncbi:MAG: SRPBCC family protein, partial [Candidatus Aminicenantales bacterium]
AHNPEHRCILGTEKKMPNAHVHIDVEAPAIAEAEAFIQAPIETVWSILSDFQNWPAWNKSVLKMRVDGPVMTGTTFEWLADGWRITSRLEEVDPPKRIAWSGATLGIRAMHVWDLAEEGQGTHVHTVESFEGLVPRLLRGFTRKTLAESLNKGMAALKAEAELWARRS